MSILRDLRKKAKLLQSDVANKLGISPQTYSNYEKGARKPTPEMLASIADFFGVSADYLLGRTEIPNAVTTNYNNAVFLGDVEPIEKDIINVPILGTIAAGIPMFCNDNYIGNIEIPAKWLKNSENYFALVVNGDSMYPKYLEGDIVILRQAQVCNDGQVCAVLVGNEEATIKTVKLHKDGIMLVPYNNKYSPIYFTNKEIKELPIIIQGIAVRIIRDE